MMLIVKVMLIAAAVVLLALTAVYFGQRRLIYFPQPQRVDPAGWTARPVSERLVKTPDGESLVTWWSPARPGMATVLYFHGNAGDLAGRADRISWFQEAGYGIVILAYRGYSGSTGSPSEQANVADARLVYDEVVKSGVPPQRVIVYGESLGSGVAVQLAVSRKVGGLVLDAPYTSIAEVGAAAYPWLPVRALISDRYETLSFVPAVTAPLLILHGDADRVIPVEMGRRVFAAANASSAKELVVVPGAGHSDHPSYGSYEALSRWLARIGAAGSANGSAGGP